MRWWATCLVSLVSLSGPTAHGYACAQLRRGPHGCLGPGRSFLGFVDRGFCVLLGRWQVAKKVYLHDECYRFWGVTFVLNQCVDEWSPFVFCLLLFWPMCANIDVLWHRHKLVINRPDQLNKCSLALADSGLAPGQLTLLWSLLWSTKKHSVTHSRVLYLFVCVTFLSQQYHLVYNKGPRL